MQQWIYIILVIILSIVFGVPVMALAYMKLRHRFWSKQPVFHYYNLWYWLFPPGIINKDVPKMNEYVNIVNVKTRDILELCDDECINIVEFIANHYLRTKTTLYVPQKKHIMSYFQNNNHASYVSVYSRPKLSYDNIVSDKKIPLSKLSVDNEYMGVITAKSLNITFKNKPTFSTYYIDNLCVHDLHRKKGIAQNLIQTIYYELRNRNDKINTCLFKREGEMTAIVPFTTFITKGYEVNKLLNYVPSRLHASYTCIEITKRLMHSVVDFIYKHSMLFDCVIAPDIANIITLVTSDIIDIRAIMYNGEIVAIHIFRDAAVEYKDANANRMPGANANRMPGANATGNANATGKANATGNAPLLCKTIDCIASLVTPEHNNILLIGFIDALRNSSKKYHAKYVLIESTSHNSIILNNLSGVNTFLKSPTAFFFYNYVCRSIKPNKLLILY